MKVSQWLDLLAQKKSLKMAVRFHKDWDNMSTADFYLRMENKPPKNEGKYYKIDKIVSKRTRRPLRWFQNYFLAHDGVNYGEFAAKKCYISRRSGTSL